MNTRPFDSDEIGQAVGVTRPYPKMAPEASAAWNSWARGVAEGVAASKVKALEKQVVQAGEALLGLAEDAGHEVRLLRDRVKALEGEVVGLRERTASLQGELRGRSYNSPEVDLPALPGEARSYRHEN